MRLSPREIEKMILHNAGFIAQKRLWRGLRLNYPEAVALIATQILELIRDGDSTVAELMDRGKRVLGYANVLPQVPELMHEVQVEGTFPDGTKLVTVHEPICTEQGDLELALYGSGLLICSSSGGSKVPTEETGQGHCVVPGEYILQGGDLTLNDGKETRKISVTNIGDRPVQVGSHYPFFEVNPSLKFDRKLAYGLRLNIPSGTAVRFEPGAEKVVELISISGEKVVYGANSLICGKISEANKKAAMERIAHKDFQ